jgi:hypothetical protein
MPGASAAEAVNKFLDTVSQAVSCLKPTKVLISEGARRTLNAVHGLVVGPLKLSRVRGAPVIAQLALNYYMIHRRHVRRAHAAAD